MDVLQVLSWVAITAAGLVVCGIAFCIARVLVLALLIHFLLWGIPLLLIFFAIYSASVAYSGAVDRLTGNILVLVSFSICVCWFKFDLREKLGLEKLLDWASDKAEEYEK